MGGLHDVAQVVDVAGLFGEGAELADGGHEDGRKDGHDGDHGEQFDEGEAALGSVGWRFHNGWAGCVALQIRSIRGY